MDAERLIDWTEQPRNAETPPGLLVRSEVTPTELFFVRSHGAVPAVDAEEYRLTVAGDVREALVVSTADLRERFPRTTVTATLACAGNRRAELNRVAPVPNGIPWGPGAIGNAVWTGARLGDVLHAAGIAPEARHVAFTGLDDARANGGVESFGGSIPLEKALGPDVLLAYEMNGEPLTPEHGFPLRAVVPGYIGARSVKWLATVSVQRSPSASFFQVSDYALAGEPLGELPLNSAVCTPSAGETVRGDRIPVEGYAIGAGGRPVESVEVSPDGGRSWLAATLAQDAGERGAWRRWQVAVELGPGSHELVVRARDGSHETQPDDMATTWNPRGYLNNAWHRVRITTRRPQPPQAGG